MAETATRQLLDGIAAFREAYRGDPKFKAVIIQANALEQAAEALVPDAYDKTSDAADQPKDLQGASDRVLEMIRAKKKADKKMPMKMDMEDMKDGGKDESKEAS